MVHQDLCIFSSASLSQVNRGRETHHIELPSKEWGSAILRLPFVRGMVLEELAFGLEGDADLLVCFNVSLPSVHDRNVTQSQRNDPSGQNVDDVSASIPISKCQPGGQSRNGGKSRVHKIDLGQDTDRPRPLRVDLPRQLQPIRVRQILVTRRDRQNDTTRLRNILQQHIPDLLLDILRLITDGHFGHTGQVDKG